MTLAEEFQQTWQTQGSSELFLGHLKNLGLLDIGMLEQIYTDNTHGLIQLFNDTLDKIDAELCLISGLGQLAAGQLGLILYPQQSIEVATKQKDISQPLYSKQYAKFIPLSSPSLLPVKLTNGAEGILIGGGPYSLAFRDKLISLASDSLNVTIDTQTAEIHMLASQATNGLEMLVNSEGISAYIGEAEYTVTKDSVMSKLGNTQYKLSSDGIELKGSVTINGDVEITGNFSAGNGNFTVDK